MAEEEGGVLCEEATLKVLSAWWVLDQGLMCGEAALNVLSGWLVPDQDLEALSASYFDSSLAAKESSWTKVSGVV